MRSLIFLIIVYIIKWLIDEISKPDVSKVDQLIKAIPNKKTVKYYSNGIELPYPFHIEYKIIIRTMANSWIYENEYKELVNENHNAPIIDREVSSPYIQKFTYTLNNIFLAESYLSDQRDYLNNLN
jgi:hypothetical protein